MAIEVTINNHHPFPILESLDEVTETLFKTSKLILNGIPDAEQRKVNFSINDLVREYQTSKGDSEKPCSKTFLPDFCKVLDQKAEEKALKVIDRVNTLQNSDKLNDLEPKVLGNLNNALIEIFFDPNLDENTRLGAIDSFKVLIPHLSDSEMTKGAVFLTLLKWTVPSESKLHQQADERLYDISMHEIGQYVIHKVESLIEHYQGQRKIRKIMKAIEREKLAENYRELLHIYKELQKLGHDPKLTKEIFRLSKELNELETLNKNWSER